MKNIFLALLLVTGLGFAQTYNNSTDPDPIPVLLRAGPVTEFVMDVTLDSGETGLSKWYDVGALPFSTVRSSSDVLAFTNRRDSLGDYAAGDSMIYHLGTETVTSTGSVTLDLDGGDLMYSCYDTQDSSGIHDTVHVYVYTEQSDYAGDGQRPSWAKSDPLDTLHTDSVIGQSNTQTIVETTRQLTFDDESVRYVRWRTVNGQDNAQSKNDIRCRIYWTRKERLD